MDKLLLVTGVRAERDALVELLSHHFQISVAENLDQSKQFLSKDHFDIVLAENDLGDGRGLELCAQLRESHLNSDSHLLLMALDMPIHERVQGFTWGASDILSKPIDPAELVARIRARLRERSGRRSILRFGQLLVLKPDQQEAFLNQNDQMTDLNLTTVEFKILSCFISAPDRIWTREDLLEAVWGKGVYVGDRSVDVHVSNLRKKLGIASHHLRSVYGVGYAFSSEPKLTRRSDTRANETMKE